MSKLVNVLSQIEMLEQSIKTPYSVMRTFGNLTIYGSNVCMQSCRDNDYVTLQEFQKALEWLVEQSGGVVAWDAPKKAKKEVKK